MRLKSFVSMMAVVGLVVGCSQQPTAAEAATSTPSRESAGGGQRADGGGLNQKSEPGSQGTEGGNVQLPTAKEPTPAPSGSGEPASGEKREKDNLLFRVQFAGTTALLANTNAAYLTNFATLPETAAFGTQIVARVASLPGRFFGQRGARNAEREARTNGNTGEHRTSNIEHRTSTDQPPTNGSNLPRESEVRGPRSEGGTGTNRNAGTATPHPQSLSPAEAERADGAHGVTRPTGGDLLRPVFAEMLRDGFTLELRGNNGAVTDFALAAKADAETSKRWQSAWKTAATNWPAANKLAVNYSGDWFFVAGSRTDPAAALGAIQKTAGGVALEAGSVLQGELVSSLLPGPVQRSVYGAFERLRISVRIDNQSLKVRGTATYAADLPKLSPPPAVPTNLVTESVVSFTMVREPGAWLEPNSPLRRFLPNPVPDPAWFWGGEGSPYQFFMAVPLAGSEAFNNEFGPALVNQIQPIANFIGSGNIVLDTNQAAIQWRGMPFVLPRAYMKNSGTNQFVVAEAFPQADFPPGLTPALIERVTDRSNLVLFDWEYITLRFDTWFRIGSLAMLCGNHEQLLGRTPTLNMIQKIQLHMKGNPNVTTEITQTGPRELTLNRRGPFAVNSLELFWLANWLESPNFPAANFLVPMEE